MTPLFPGDPLPLPPDGGSLTATVWTVGADDAPPPRVRHALGYEEFVAFAAGYGTAASRLFDLWAFAHFVRAHRERLDGDPGLLRSATVFLGNVCIANHPECFWPDGGPDLRVVSRPEIMVDGPATSVQPEDARPGDEEIGRYLGVGGTVPAILVADEARFLEFRGVVERWSPGAPPPRVRRIPSR